MPRPSFGCARIQIIPEKKVENESRKPRSTVPKPRSPGLRPRGSETRRRSSLQSEARFPPPCRNLDRTNKIYSSTPSVSVSAAWEIAFHINPALSEHSRGRRISLPLSSPPPLLPLSPFKERVAFSDSWTREIMVVEAVVADITPSQVKEGIEGDNTFLAEMDSKTKSNQGQGLDGLRNFDSVDDSHGLNGESKEGDHVANLNFPKDAVDEWPAPKQIHTLCFVKYRSYEDPKLKAKIEQADKEIQKKNQARFQITEALRAKRSERAQVIAQLKPLTAEDKQYRMIMDEKRKEMKPFQEALGKLRSANNDVREKGMGLCSSEEELNELIQSLHYRMQHESLTLVEEKQLMKEIKQLEGTREKVIINAAMRAKIQDSLGQREAIQDQVKLLGGDIDGLKKEQQAVRMKIRQLEEELKTIDGEIISLQEELTAVNEKKDKAFETLNELRKARDEANACYFQNRSLLNTAKDLAAKKDIASLQELAHAEEEKFMSQWNSNKDFRDDYKKRILPSLDIRQLSRDGRMRNPDEKPIVSEAPSTEPETMPIKASVKQAKEGANPAPLHDTVTSRKLHDDGNTKSTEVASKRKMSGPMETENTSVTDISQKEPSKVEEIDTVKLKEMKREEEIAKAQLALERKKRQAEKTAAKAAIRAQKEAEKKLKEKEKRARKKAGTSAPAAPDEQTEMDMQIMEPEDTNVNIEAPTSESSKEQKEKARYRNRPKGRAPLPRVILKRKKSHSYWLWAAPAVVVALVLVLLSYYFSFGRN